MNLLDLFCFFSCLDYWSASNCDVSHLFNSIQNLYFNFNFYIEHWIILIFGFMITLMIFLYWIFFSNFNIIYELIFIFIESIHNSHNDYCTVKCKVMWWIVDEIALDWGMCSCSTLFILNERFHDDDVTVVMRLRFYHWTALHTIKPTAASAIQSNPVLRVCNKIVVVVAILCFALIIVETTVTLHSVMMTTTNQHGNGDDVGCWYTRIIINITRLM